MHSDGDYIVVEDVYVPFKITSVIEDSSTLTLDEVYVSSGVLMMLWMR